MSMLFLVLVTLWQAGRACANLMDEYEIISNSYLNYKANYPVYLPVYLGVDRSSGCLCRGSENLKATVCFGGYDCKKIPKVEKTEHLRIRTTMITEVSVGSLDQMYFLKILEFDSNHQLTNIEPGAFKNLSHLEQLSISYSVKLSYIKPDTFQGLFSLKNLTMVNNYFSSIIDLSHALRPSILPALEWLDVSENVFDVIPENAFEYMQGSNLRRIELDFCQVDYLHPNSFTPLMKLKELVIGGNNVNTSVLADCLESMSREGINLGYLDISSMGFRKHPPKRLLETIANTTIKRLSLAQNQFETMLNSSFPRMVNLEVLNLKKVSCVYIEEKAFGPELFPNLKALFLSDNILPGLHTMHDCNQIKLLDLSGNTELNTVYFEISRNAFLQCRNLRILNLSFNTIKSLFDYAFVGLDKLRWLNLENTTLYYLGNGIFNSTPRLEVLNLANNPLTASENLTSKTFAGLNELKMIVMRNCGIQYFDLGDNMFNSMPNLTHLILKNNRLFYLLPILLTPLKKLEVLDLSDNLLIAWGQPLFYPTGPYLRKFFLTNNKLSSFSTSMLQDMNYLLENNKTIAEIDLRYNVFVCECNSMYTPYNWIAENGSVALKEYFASSKFYCSTPDVWEGRTVADFFNTLKTVRCYVYNRISNLFIMVWTGPTVILILMIIVSIIAAIKYKVYIKYWLFLAKLALGRRLSRVVKTDVEDKTYKFDAFVSYCNDDRDIVIEMVAHLEREAPYLKLCVYERDFEIGSFISEAILTSINESRYIVLIVSDAFAKSQWCRWETQLAEYHRLFLEDGSQYDPLILVKIGDLNRKNMSPTLKYLLKTKIYIAWHEHCPDELWKKLRAILSRK